jgi:hypothetical protein
MFCPKCGVENQEDAKLCRSCSSPLPTIAFPPSPAKTSALAITTMILGILSFCTFLLTAPLAIIFGIISMVMIAKSNGQLKGTGFAITGIVTPVVAVPFVAICLGIMMPALARARMVDQRMVCGENMSSLEHSIFAYASDNNDMYPATDKWCDLLIKSDPSLTKRKFRCPGDKEGPSSYAMNKNIEKLGTNSPPDMVLLFDSKPGWNQSGGAELLTTENHKGDGCNIMFNDSHVEFVRAEDINKLRWTAGP